MKTTKQATNTNDVQLRDNTRTNETRQAVNKIAKGQGMSKQASRTRTAEHEQARKNLREQIENAGDLKRFSFRKYYRQLLSNRKIIAINSRLGDKTAILAKVINERADREAKRQQAIDERIDPDALFAEIDKFLESESVRLFERVPNEQATKQIDGINFTRASIEVNNDKPEGANVTEFHVVRNFNKYIELKRKELSELKKKKRASKSYLFDSEIDVCSGEIEELLLERKHAIDKCKIVKGFEFVSLERFEDSAVELEFLKKASRQEIASRYYLSVYKLAKKLLAERFGKLSYSVRSELLNGILQESYLHLETKGVGILNKYWNKYTLAGQFDTENACRFSTFIKWQLYKMTESYIINNISPVHLSSYMNNKEYLINKLRKGPQNMNLHNINDIKFYAENEFDLLGSGTLTIDRRKSDLLFEKSEKKHKKLIAKVNNLLTKNVRLETFRTRIEDKQNRKQVNNTVDLNKCLELLKTDKQKQVFVNEYVLQNLTDEEKAANCNCTIKAYKGSRLKRVKKALREQIALTRPVESLTDKYQNLFDSFRS